MSANQWGASPLVGHLEEILSRWMECLHPADRAVELYRSKNRIAIVFMRCEVR